MLYRLIVLTGEAKGTRITVDPTPMLIGRDPACAIRCADSEMALRHASIEQRAEELHIRDLGTMNQILINGRETRETRLKHGDTFELGRTRFLVQASVQAELAADAPPAAIRHRKRIPLAAFAVPALIAGIGVALWAGARTKGEPHLDPDAVAALPPPEPALAPYAGPAPTEPATAAPETLPALPSATLDAPPASPPLTANDVQRIHDEILDLREFVRSMADNGPPATIVVTQHVTVVTSPPPVTAVAAVAPAAAARPTRPTAATPDPPIRIGAIEQRRFPTNEDFDEMRLVTVELHRAPDAPALARDDNTLVEFFFFDQSPDAATIEASRASPRRAAALSAVAWPAGGLPASATATYSVPKGFRAAEERAGRARAYHGVAIRIVRSGRILDESARPLTLLSRMESGPRATDTPTARTATTP